MRCLSVILVFCASLGITFGVQAEHLVRALPAPPATLDPHYFHGSVEASVLKDMFEGLTVQDERGLPVPGAAENWDVTDDGLRWTFHLREDLKWSDGTPLTSEDFLYSFRRLADPANKTKYHWYLQLSAIVNSQPVAKGEMTPDALGVSAPDAKTLVIQLEEPRSWLASMLTFPSFLPVPHKAIQVCEQNWHEMVECAVSNGAYRFEFKDEGAVGLRRNPHFHSVNDVSISEVTWKVLTSPVDEMMAFRNGELDVTTGSPLGSLLSEAPYGGAAIEYVDQLVTSYLVLNPNSEALGNKNVRKALAGILDRSAVFPACGTQAWTLTPPWTQGAGNWIPDECGQAQWKRDKQAREALAEAGYNEQNPIKIEFLTIEGYGKTTLFNDSILNQWRRLPGVEVEVVSLGWKEFVERSMAGNFQVLNGAWLAAFNDPAAFLLLGSSLSPYSLGVMGDEYDELLRKAMAESSEESRSTLYQQLEKQLIDSNAIIPLRHMINIHWLQPKVKGFTATNPEGWVPTKQLRIE